MASNDQWLQLQRASNYLATNQRFFEILADPTVARQEAHEAIDEYIEHIKAFPTDEPGRQQVLRNIVHRRAYSALYSKFFDDSRRVIGRVLHDHETFIEEVSIDLWEHLWAVLPTTRMHEPKAYIVRAARNRAISTLREIKRRLRELPLDELGELIDRSTLEYSQEDMVWRREMAEILEGRFFPALLQTEYAMLFRHIQAVAIDKFEEPICQFSAMRWILFGNARPEASLRMEEVLQQLAGFMGCGESTVRRRVEAARAVWESLERTLVLPGLLRKFPTGKSEA